MLFSFSIDFGHLNNSESYIFIRMSFLKQTFIKFQKGMEEIEIRLKRLLERPSPVKLLAVPFLWSLVINMNYLLSLSILKQILLLCWGLGYLCLFLRNSYPFIPCPLQACYHIIEYFILQMIIFQGFNNPQDYAVLFLLPTYLFLNSKSKLWCFLFVIMIFLLSNNSGVISFPSDKNIFPEIKQERVSFFNSIGITMIILLCWALTSPAGHIDGEMNVNNFERRRDLVNSSLESDLTIMKLGFAHDIRNLLNFISSFLVTVLLKYNLHKDVYEILDSLSKTCDYLTILMNQFFEMTLEQSFNPSSDEINSFCSSTELLEKVYKIMSPSILLKNLQSTLVIEPNTPAKLPIKLKDIMPILINIISNAIKYTDKGYVNVKIYWEANSSKHFSFTEVRSETLESIDEIEPPANKVKTVSYSPSLKSQASKKDQIYPESPDTTVSKQNTIKGKINFVISDSGSGIAKENLHRVFEKYSKFHKLKSGTGIGLWYSKWIADKINGTINVKSTPSLGTVFYVIIPCEFKEKVDILEKPYEIKITKKKEESRRFLDESSFMTFVSSNATRPKIIIADDDVISLKALKSILSRMNIPCLTANDGKEALDLFKLYSDDIDIIILDFQMSRMNGLEAAKNIRKCQKSKIPAIIGITGHSHSSILNEGLSAGMNEVYVKPLKTDVLIRIMQNYSNKA